MYNTSDDVISSVIRELYDNGHEIGLHGSYNSYSCYELLSLEKSSLQRLTGIELSGIRQHFLNYDNKITPLLHNKCKFDYDSSIGIKPDIGIGFKRGTSFPYYISLPNGEISNILEIPLVIMDTSLEHNSSFDDCMHILNQVERHGGALTISGTTTN
jgi:hypothetical protein